MACRLDKFVWSVRLVKTRSKATEAVSKGKVKINDVVSKPSKEVKVGDVVQIVRHTSIFSFKVLQTLSNRVGAKLVDQYIVDVTSVEEIERYKQYQLNQSAYRSYGTGKPSKKDRRDLSDYVNDFDEL